MGSPINLFNHIIYSYSEKKNCIDEKENFFRQAFYGFSLRDEKQGNKLHGGKKNLFYCFNNFNETKREISHFDVQTSENKIFSR